MTTILSEGVIVPDVGDVNWAGKLEVNWNLLNGALANLSGNVKTDRDNTWTGEQSFTLPIVGSITGTASKAIADEDGTSIKTGYVNVAGNQTVTGQKTWTGEQTFSQTIQGNAATASAFDTAKSITLTGAVTGTVSGTNSWEIATALKTGSAATGGTVPAPYFKIASWEVAPNDYFGTILQIQNKYYPHQIATLTIGLRTKTDATFQRGYSLLNNAIGIQSSAFILCYKEVTGKVLCELYYYTTTSFNGIRFSVISEGTRNDSSVFNTMVVYQNPAGIAALPSDYTVIQTTIGTYTQDFIPYSTNTYSLGSSSYQWSSVYAQTYYYNGTAWGLDNANTWTNNNIFNKNVNPASVTSIADTTLAFNGLLNTIFLNTRGSSNRRSYGSFLFVGYGSASGADNYGQIQLLRSTDKRGDTNEGYIPDTSFKLLRVNPHSLLIDFMENVRVVNDGTYNTLCPITTNATDLGTSTNKWKTLNGINPGALSLPDFTSETGVSLSAGANTYTPVLSGWLSISTTGDISVVCGNFCHKATDMISVPVIAGKTYTVTMPSAATGYFYSCLGNV